MSGTARECRAGDTVAVDREDPSALVKGAAVMAIKEGSVEHGERLAREEAETIGARMEHKSFLLENSTGRQTEPPQSQSCSIRTPSSTTIGSKDETDTYCPERNSTTTLAVSIASRQNSSIINSTLLEAIRRVIKGNSAVASSNVALKGQIAGVQHKVVPVKSTPVLVRVLPPSNKTMAKETGSTIGNSSSNNLSVTDNATSSSVTPNSSCLQMKPTVVNGRTAVNGCLASLPTAAGCDKTAPPKYESPEARAAKEKIIAGYKRILDNAAVKWGTPLLQRKDINCDTMALNKQSPTAHNTWPGREDTVNVSCSGPIYSGAAVSKTSYSSQKDIPLLQREDITIGDVSMPSSRMGITIDKDKNARVSDRPRLPDTIAKCKSMVPKSLPIHDIPLLQRTDLAIDGVLSSKSVVGMYHMNRRKNANILNQYLKKESATEYKASKDPSSSATEYETCKEPPGSLIGATSFQRKDHVFDRRSTCRPAPHSDTEIMATRPRERTVDAPNGLMTGGALNEKSKKVIPKLACLVMERKYKTVTDVLNDKPVITTYSRKKAARNRIKVITCTAGGGSTGSHSGVVRKADPRGGTRSLASQHSSSLSLMRNQVVHKESLSRSVAKKEMCNVSDILLGCAKVNKLVVFEEKKPIQSNNLNVPQDDIVSSSGIPQTFSARDSNWEVRQERSDSLSDKIASNTTAVCNRLHQPERANVLEDSSHAVNHSRKQMQYGACRRPDDVSKGKCVPAVICSSVPHMNGQLHKEPNILDGSVALQAAVKSALCVSSCLVNSAAPAVTSSASCNEMQAVISNMTDSATEGTFGTQMSVNGSASLGEDHIFLERQDSSTCEHDGNNHMPSYQVNKQCLGLHESTVLNHEENEMREGNSVLQISPSQDRVQDAVAEEEKLCDDVPVEKDNASASQLTVCQPTPSSNHAIVNVDEAARPSVGQLTALTVKSKLLLQQGKCATADSASARRDGTAAGGCSTSGSASVRLDSSVVNGCRTPGSATSGCRTPGSATSGCNTPGSASVRLDSSVVNGCHTPGSATSGCRTPGSVTSGCRTPGSATSGCSTPGSASVRLDGSVVNGCRTPGSATSGCRTPGSAAPACKIVVLARPNLSASVRQRSPTSLERQFDVVISPPTCAGGVSEVGDDDETVSTLVKREECGEPSVGEELLPDGRSVARTVEAAPAPCGPSARGSGASPAALEPVVDVSQQVRRRTAENCCAAHSHTPRRVVGGIYADVVRDTNVTREASQGKEGGRCSQRTCNRFDELNQNTFQTFSEFRAQQLPSQSRARGFNSICAVAAENPASTLAGPDSKSRTSSGAHLETRDCKENLTGGWDDPQLDVRKRQKPGYDSSSWRQAAGPSRTMQDLIYRNPPANPMRKTAAEPMIFMDYEEEDKDPDEVEEEVPAPQVMLDDDGQLVIDERSLFVDVEEVARRRVQRGRKRRAGDSLAATIDSELSPAARSRNWKSSETLKFYRALNAVGTDFSTMEALFLDRTRRELKQKFLREDRAHRELIDRTLQNPGVFTILDMEQELEEEKLEKKKKEEEESKKERLKKARTDRKLSDKQQQLWDRRNEQLLCNKIIFKSKRNYKRLGQKAESEARPVRRAVQHGRKRKQPRTDPDAGQDLCKLLEETISQEVTESCEGRSVLPPAATTPGSLLVLSAPSPTGRVYKVFMVGRGPNARAPPEL